MWGVGVLFIYLFIYLFIVGGSFYLFIYGGSFSDLWCVAFKWAASLIFARNMAVLD